ncbi:MAG: leucyl aminopeptidase family protein [Gammaproteobacteria bacterium]|nr:leucyl aminopeptidase family protein [Gammaproteobacteria bacterium]
MPICFAKATTKKAIPVIFVLQNDYAQWIKKQDACTQNWLTTSKFRGEAGSISQVPNKSGQLAAIVFCINDFTNMWSVGGLPFLLPEGQYIFQLADKDYISFAIAWGLGAYQFTRYKKPLRLPAQLVIPNTVDHKRINNIVESIYLVRDLINIPTDDMGPSELAASAVLLSKQYKATCKQIIGKDLLKNNYACVYTVGRASDDPPRFIDLRWGKATHPKVTLVGKGVCFDSGGLNIKPSSGMQLMKKDMAGAAHALGLARMIMEAKLPVRLRVLIPAVENVISGNAYRPGDIIKSRKGTTIEIGNTDAEGRVVMADALTEAVSENPDLLIDLSTLTGAARVAVGTDISAVFANNDDVVSSVIKQGEKNNDPIWRLPLFAGYRESLNSSIADINNNSTDGYAGAITAALFLQEFVPSDIPWLHFDMMAWNLRARPGRPQGGEAMALRALFSYLEKRFN